MFAENVQNHDSRYTSHGAEFAASYDSIIELMKRLHAESLAIFAKLTAEDLQGKCKTPGGAEIQTSKWLRAMVEHEVHHRGQIYLYLEFSVYPRRHSTVLHQKKCAPAAAPTNFWC